MVASLESRVRVGVPYRTLREEQSGENRKHEFYCESVRQAGGEAVPVSLQLDDAPLARLLNSLDAFVTTGSPADVDPARYGAARHERCGPADPARERTDWAIYEHALAEGKPVLAICYGAQSLNVFFGGTLIQDIPSEFPRTLRHTVRPTGEVGATPAADPMHEILIEPQTYLAELAASPGAASNSTALTVQVNTSHHQAILVPGRGLRVSAKAPDGIIEAVEYVGTAMPSDPGDRDSDLPLIIGVQWHPERMAGDAFSISLFRALVRAGAGVVPQAT
ncbi:MAG TPA: gamma-glutamyl-gamma-aminobutyrate hydrolase family protein [Candidatus Acidoferrales bacterium]|nr:gamma-glutamyl-gamma-aminobutyrate hydrolase family protein [Candidatus Acidoferrales bacterium]